MNVPKSSDPEKTNSRASLSWQISSRDKVLVGLYQTLRSLDDPKIRKAISALAREQLRRSILPDQSRADVQLENGLKIELDLQDLFAAEFYVEHFNERRFLDALTASIPKDAVAADIGANFGLYALHCAQIGCRVLAFEPAPFVFELLEKNTRLNNLKEQIASYCLPISDSESEVQFFVASDGSFSGLRDTGRSEVKQVVKTKTRTLDSVIAESKISKLDFLKIDVEGAEWRVLSGAENTILNNDELVIFFEWSEKNLDEEDLKKLREQTQHLIKIGYELCLVDAQSSLLDPISSPKDVPADYSGSILAMRPQCKWGAHLKEAYLSASDLVLDPYAASAATYWLVEQLRSLRKEQLSLKSLLRDATANLDKTLKKLHSYKRAAEKGVDLSAEKDKIIEDSKKRFDDLREKFLVNVDLSTEKDKIIEDSKKRFNDLREKFLVNVDILQSKDQALEASSEKVETLKFHTERLEQRANEQTARLDNLREKFLVNVDMLQEKGQALETSFEKVEALKLHIKRLEQRASEQTARLSDYERELEQAKSEKEAFRSLNLQTAEKLEVARKGLVTAAQERDQYKNLNDKLSSENELLKSNGKLENATSPTQDDTH